MSTLARHPFWLDGGYDRESVEACQYHPDHKWWVFRMGDVIDCEHRERRGRGRGALAGQREARSAAYPLIR